MKKLLLLLAPALLSVTSFAHAQQFTVSVTVDENGHGRLTNTNGFNSPLPFSLAPDPGPGGLASTLTYGLLNPPGLVAGDVFLKEDTGSPTDGFTLDVVRFNSSNGTLVFYSDNLAGFNSLADTASPPTAFYTNTITIDEINLLGGSGAIYTPLAGQPGFVAGAAGPVTYTLLSDAAPTPEPGSLVLLGTGMSGVLAMVRRRFVRA